MRDVWTELYRLGKDICHGRVKLLSAARSCCMQRYLTVCSSAALALADVNVLQSHSDDDCRTAHFNYNNLFFGSVALGA